MSLLNDEYRALRKTIATRSTVRIALVPITVLGWSLLACTLLLLGEVPLAVVFPLLVLAAGFEAVHAMHVGVERIGRYLQVFYEARTDGPRWETSVMAVGPSLPGSGSDPLFSIVFGAGAVLNLIPAALLSPTPVEIAVLAALHLALLARIVRARVAASRQRAIDLESFRAIKSVDGGVKL